MNYFAQYENPGNFYHYDRRNDPRAPYNENINLPDPREVQSKPNPLERVKNEANYSD